MSAQASQPTAKFWLSDALTVLGTYAGAYANNRLAYESARDEIELNNLRMQGYMTAAQQAQAVQGSSGLPEQIGGVPTGVVILALIAAGVAIYWAAK